MTDHTAHAVTMVEPPRCPFCGSDDVDEYTEMTVAEMGGQVWQCQAEPCQARWDFGYFDATTPLATTTEANHESDR